jgi:thiol-disulfide isomerase/thioredoxin
MVQRPYGRCPAASLIAVAACLVGITANAEPILLLDFWSPSCGPCMQMKPVVHSFEQAGYPIRQVDTTRDFQLSRQYNVTQIPCFVMLVNGQETERQVGEMSTSDMEQMFKRAQGEYKRQQDRVRMQSQDNVAATRTVSVGPAPQPGDQTFAPKNSVPADKTTPDANQVVANTPASAHAKLLAATVRLYVEDAQGRSFGTGTIIDTRSGEALVVTCAHLFRESKGKAPVKADLYEAAGDGVRVVGHAVGQVISFDLERDVALVSIRPDRSVTVATVAAPKSLTNKGDRVVGIGCSNGNDPTVMETRVTAIDRYQGHPNIEASGAPAIGRSGGGLFNSRGELIGICNNADPEGNEGIYAGIESIHEELNRLGLKEIYSKPGSTQVASQQSQGSNAAIESPVIRLQAPGETSLTNDSTPPSTSTPPRNLSETEQAALEEIMSRAVESEVVCIIRPKDASGQSEVIHLEKVSPEFLRALRERTAPSPKMR